MTGVAKAIAKAGGVSALARHLGVTRQRVQNWYKQGWVPKDYVVEIEAEFGVSRRELLQPEIRDLTAGVFE